MVIKCSILRDANKEPIRKTAATHTEVHAVEYYVCVCVAQARDLTGTHQLRIASNLFNSRPSHWQMGLCWTLRIMTNTASHARGHFNVRAILFHLSMQPRSHVHCYMA